jgi:hypothetical protein
MKIKDKLDLAEGEGICGFAEGLFVRIYEQSLFWAVKHIQPMKVLYKSVKYLDGVLGILRVCR